MFHPNKDALRRNDELPLPLSFTTTHLVHAANKNKQKTTNLHNSASAYA